MVVGIVGIPHCVRYDTFWIWFLFETVSMTNKKSPEAGIYSASGLLCMSEPVGPLYNRKVLLCLWHNNPHDDVQDDAGAAHQG